MTPDTRHMTHDTKHTRRSFLRAMACGTAGIAAMSLAGPLISSSGRKDKERPNILLIMADDMGYSDIGCYGSEIHTPHIDSLAENGLRFTQFYNNARCCPSRASLLTGLYPHQAGIGLMTADDGLPGYRGELTDDAVTIAEVLKGAGYQTGGAGKWHLTKFNPEDQQGWPLQRGFDRWYGIIRGASSYYNPVSLLRGNRQIEPEGEDYYFTDAVTENLLGMIDNFAAADAPYFLYASYTAPHWPLHALQKDIEKYEGTYLKGWDALREQRYRRMVEMGIIKSHWDLSPRDSRVEPWAEAQHKDWQARRMAVYSAQIDRMDQGIGRLLDRLRKRGEYENTLVLFLADNGGCAERLSERWRGLPAIPDTTRDGRPVQLGNDPGTMPGPEDTYQSYGIPWANVSDTPFRWYKHYIHEGGIATPLVISWPGRIRKKGGLEHGVGHIIDVMATVLDVTKTEYPDTHRERAITPIEGKSLLPLFSWQERAGHEILGWEHHGNKGLRAGRWKLVSTRSGEWELYDMEADRTELHDLSSQMPEKVQELEKHYQEWADWCDVIPYERLMERRKSG